MTTVAEKLNLKVGSTAFISDAYSRPKSGKVTRITLTGQVVVEVTPANGGAPYTYRFNDRGREIGGRPTWRFAALISEDVHRRIIASNKKENEATRIRNEISSLVKLPLGDRDLPNKLEDLARRLRAWQLES